MPIALLQSAAKTVRVQVVDWKRPANNDSLLVSQFSVTDDGKLGTGSDCHYFTLLNSVEW
jgi:hypothetical protein